MRKFCAVAVNGIKTGQSGRKPCRGKNILIFDILIFDILMMLIIIINHK